MKILILRFSSIGDIVLTTPIIRCIKNQLPNAEIHFLTKKSFENILAPNPNINKLWTIEKEIDTVIPQLKAEKFDFIIDLHNNLRTFRLKRKLNVKTYSFPKVNFQKFLLTAFKINKLPNIHVIDRYFEAVKPLGVNNDFLPVDYFLQKEDFIDLETFSLESKNFIAVTMGAQFGTKQIPVSLLEKILADQNLPIVLLGGKDDVLRSKELMNRFPEKKIVDFCGTISLGKSAFLCKEAKVLLCSDTGLMHITSAFETPIVSVWGNTVPELGMYAYSPQDKNKVSIHEVKDLKCRPCSKIGYASCPKKHFKCMENQDVEKIVKDLNILNLNLLSQE